MLGPNGKSPMRSTSSFTLLFTFLEYVLEQSSTPVVFCRRGVDPKRGELKEDINQFRLISLLSVEGKIPFSIVAKQLVISQEPLY